MFARDAPPESPLLASLHDLVHAARGFSQVHVVSLPEFEHICQIAYADKNVQLVRLHAA